MPKHLSADQDLVRKVNKSLVLNTLRLHAPISRAGVAKLTGLNRSTVTHIINALLEEGLVCESEVTSSPIGRPSISLTLRPEGGAIIGVETGVDFITVLLTDFVARPIWQTVLETRSSQTQNEILKLAEETIDQALHYVSERNLKAIGIGLGLPGLVNVAEGELIYAPNLGWQNAPIRSLWEQHFGIPVYIENEANLSALGEYYFGQANKVDNFVYLSSGIGLGGGVIMGGKLFRGGHGFAGEVGHMQRDPDGELCGCGRRGCWETQVGPRAVLRRIKRDFLAAPDLPRPKGVASDLSDLTFQKVVDAALQGDPLCLGAIEEVAVHLGAGIADLVNIFNPEMVVIGGALSLARQIILPVIEKTVLQQALTPSVNQTRITFSERGKDACVYGAVAVVLDDVLRELAIV